MSDEKRNSRRAAWAFAGVVLLVAAVLVWVFTRFANSLVVVIALVTFVLAYMILIGYLAGRHSDRRD